MGKVFRGFWEEKLSDGRRTMHRPGDEVKVSGDVLARLERLGVVVDEGKAQPAPSPVPEPEPVGEESAPATAEKPWKTAKLDVWQDYARSQGVDPSGLSKQELIAKLG